MLTIFRKELADHFSSTRFVILFCLIFMIALVITIMVSADLKDNVAKPSYAFLQLFTMRAQFFSLVEFIAFFGPLIGIITGFDAINRERNAGTLSKVISQPIYRDAVINGKFLAGLTTIAIMLTGLVILIAGLELTTVGVVPGAEELARLAVYLIVSIAYVGFWLGLSILFSIFFRSIATSALASGALWIFFSFFVPFGAGLLANLVAPLDPPVTLEKRTAHHRVIETASLASPAALYSTGTSSILNPFQRTTNTWIFGTMGENEQISLTWFENPLPFGQSLQLVLPYLLLLLGLTVVCFVISYLAFMRQEIRSM